MDDITLTLNHPLTEQQWDAIADVDFDHTDSIWFTTKNGKEVEFVKRKKGHWIGYPECLGYDGAYYKEQYVCSECHQVFDCIDNCMEDWNCCPGCGAKMDKEE